MAVERVGTYTLIQDSSASGSQAVELDGTTTLLIVCLTGWENGEANWMTGVSFTYDSDSMTVAAQTSSQNSYPNAGIWYLANPSTESNTFAWDYGVGDALDEGGHIIILQYKGVNTGDPIGDSDINTSGDDVTGMTAGAGDMMVGVVSSYGTNAPDADQDSQTEIVVSDSYNTERAAVAEEVGDGDFYSTGIAPTAAAVVLAAAAAGGLEMEIAMHHRRMMG